MTGPLDRAGLAEAAGGIVTLVNAGAWARDLQLDEPAAGELLRTAAPTSCPHGLAYALAGMALLEILLDDLAAVFAIDRPETVRRLAQYVRDGDLPAGGLVV